MQCYQISFFPRPTIRLLTGLLLCVIALQHQSAFAEEADAADQTKPSMSELLTDPEDGKLDASAFLATTKGFLPIVSIITEPAVGFGAALALVFFHDSIQNRAEQMKQLNAEGKQVRLAPPSLTGVFGLATENGSRMGGVFHFGVWKHDQLRYTGALMLPSMNLDFYGIGDFLPIDSVSYKLKGHYFLQELVSRLGGSDFFLGGNYKHTKFDVNLDSAINIPGIPQRVTIRSSGIGLVAKFDSRNSIFTPDSGTNINIEASFYREALGSDNNFTMLSTHFRTWLPLHSNWTLGLRLDGDFSSDSTPFYMLPAISLRGISATRYQGEQAVTVEAELRWDFTPRWSLVGFAGAGRTATNTMNELVKSKTHPAAGAGFRYLLARLFHLRVGLDVAKSQEESAIYITMGSAW